MLAPTAAVPESLAKFVGPPERDDRPLGNRDRPRDDEMPVRGDIIVRRDGAWRKADRKQRVATDDTSLRAQLEARRHHRALRRSVEQLLAVATPHGLHAATERNLITAA